MLRPCVLPRASKLRGARMPEERAKGDCSHRLCALATLLQLYGKLMVTCQRFLVHPPDGQPAVASVWQKCGWLTRYSHCRAGPICARSVKLQANRDIYDLFDEHMRTNCDPSNYQRVHKKPRCPVLGCRCKLGLLDAYRCKRCGQRVCLAHRLESDHSCPGACRRPVFLFALGVQLVGQMIPGKNATEQCCQSRRRKYAQPLPAAFFTRIGVRVALAFTGHSDNDSWSITARSRSCLLHSWPGSLQPGFSVAAVLSNCRVSRIRSFFFNTHFVGPRSCATLTSRDFNSRACEFHGDLVVWNFSANAPAPADVHY
jgi:AN1-like Zinc finger